MTRKNRYRWNRAVKLGDRLRLKLNVTKHERRAAPIYKLDQLAKLDTRIADLSSRLCLVDSIEQLIER